LSVTKTELGADNKRGLIVYTEQMLAMQRTLLTLVVPVAVVAIKFPKTPNIVGIL